jgi:hypothetical protein
LGDALHDSKESIEKLVASENVLLTDFGRIISGSFARSSDDVGVGGGVAIMAMLFPVAVKSKGNRETKSVLL